MFDRLYSFGRDSLRILKIMEIEGGKSEVITSVSPSAIGQKISNVTVDRKIPETVPVSMDYPNTIEDGISSLGTYTSYHNKLYSPGNKPDTTGTLPYSKGADVSDAKGASDKKSPQSHRTKIQ